MLAATKCLKLLPRRSLHFGSCRWFENSAVLNRHPNNLISIAAKSVDFLPVKIILPALSELRGRRKPFVTQASSNEVADNLSDSILSISEKSPNYNRETYTACIHELCRNGNLSTARNLLQSLLDKNIFLPDAYSTLLAVAGEKNDVETASQVFKVLLVSGGCLNSICYVNIARTFARTEDSTPLIRFVKDISSVAFPKSTTVVNGIIFGLAECRQIEKAILIFRQMKNFDCKADLITYNTVLEILGSGGRVNEMLSEFASMKEAGILPDFVSYNTLLNNLRKVGRLDLCIVLFKEMTGSGVAPDLLTYTALIECFGRLGNTGEALKLFSEMKQRQIRPSIHIYRSLISNLKRVGNLELVRTFLEEMKASSSQLAGPKDFKRKGRWQNERSRN